MVMPLGFGLAASGGTEATSSVTFSPSRRKMICDVFAIDVAPLA
jgi:hypothetical protein